MARELQIDVEITGTVEADAALARLANALTKAGDSADVAAAKAEKFEKSYKEGAARKAARAELEELSGSTKKVGDAAQDATKKTGGFASATEKLTAAALRFAGPAVALEAARRTIAWADDIGELAKRTSLGVEQVQQLTKVAEKNGSTFGAMAGLIQQAEVRLGSHNKQAEAAVRLMGMAPESLLKLDPLERLRAIAKGLADIKDPAQRSAAEMAVFGRAADANSAALLAVADGADKLETALGADFIHAGEQAQDVLDDIKNKALDMLRAIVLIGPAILSQAKKLDDARAKGKIAPMANQPFGVPQTIGGNAISDLIGQRIAEEQNRLANPALIDSPDNSWLGFPSPLAVPGNPMDGASGQSWNYLNRALGRPPSGGARVLPFQQRTFALGSTAASIFGMANTPGGFNAGSLPFMSSLPFLRPGGSPISFANGSGLAGTVPMNAPGGGGGFGGFLSSNKGKIAGLGLGLASRFIPQDGKIGSALSMAGQGASMGAMFGPWGMGIGAAAGGLMGLFTGGKAAKNAKSAETSQVFEQFSTKEFVAMQKEADRLGISMEKALNAKTMKDFGAAVDEVTGKIGKMTDMESEMASLEGQIKALTDAATVDFDKMNSVVKEFGLDINKMGPAFQQAAMDKEFQKIIDALAIMEKGGADMKGVLDGMKDEISKVVNDSIKFGTTIPENMRPWINKLIESKGLLDENGQVITDTSKMKFGAPMVSEMDKVVKKLDELIAKLADLAAGFRDAGTAAGDINPGGGNGGGSGSGNEGGQSQNGSGSPGFATGGVAGRDFRRPGHGDIFPALLKRGETVLPAGVSRGGVSLSIGNMSVSGGYGSRSDAVEDIGDAVVKYLERRGARLVA